MLALSVFPDPARASLSGNNLAEIHPADQRTTQPHSRDVLSHYCSGTT